MSELNIITWNFSGGGSRDNKIEIIRELTNNDMPTLLCLQEVTPGIRNKLNEMSIFDKFSFSTDVRLPGRFEPEERSVGCFTGMKNCGNIINYGLIQRAPMPEKALYIRALIDGRIVTLLNFIIPKGPHCEITTEYQFAALADFLDITNQEHMIFCGYSEIPVYDEKASGNDKSKKSVDKISKYGSLIFGDEKIHTLITVPNEKVSQKKSSTATNEIKKSKSVYDHIYFSSKFEPVEYIDYGNLPEYRNFGHSPKSLKLKF